MVRFIQRSLGATVLLLPPSTRLSTENASPTLDFTKSFCNKIAKKKKCCQIRSCSSLKKLDPLLINPHFQQPSNLQQDSRDKARNCPFPTGGAHPQRNIVWAVELEEVALTWTTEMFTMLPFMLIRNYTRFQHKAEAKDTILSHQLVPFPLRLHVQNSWHFSCISVCLGVKCVLAHINCNAGSFLLVPPT